LSRKRKIGTIFVQNKEYSTIFVQKKKVTKIFVENKEDRHNIYPEQGR